MNQRVITVAVLVLAMLAMWQIGQAVGKKVKGAPKAMETLTLPPVQGQAPRSIAITAQMKVMPNAQVYASVREGDRLLFDAVPFAMANYMDTPPKFVAVPLDETGNRVAISTDLYPENILAFIDYETPSIWPHPAAGKPFDAADPDALATLQAFKDAGAVPENARLLPTGYMPLNNDRLRALHEAQEAQKAAAPQ